MMDVSWKLFKQYAHTGYVSCHSFPHDHSDFLLKTPAVLSLCGAKFSKPRNIFKFKHRTRGLEPKTILTDRNSRNKFDEFIQYH